MRVIPTICLLILAVLPCFAQAPQASTPVTTLIDQTPLLAALDHDNSSPLSLVTLSSGFTPPKKLPVPAVAIGPTRASDLTGFGETYAPIRLCHVRRHRPDHLGARNRLGKEILKTYDPKAAKTETGKALRLNGNVARVFNEKWLARPMDCHVVWRGQSHRSSRFRSPAVAASCASSTGSDMK